MPSRPQRHKGKQRPRGWHRGKGTGQVGNKVLKGIEQVEARGAEMQAELDATRLRWEEEAFAEILELTAGSCPWVPRLDSGVFL